ncbi:MAG: hypothetical protein N3E50_00125 [Candidatus Goldbacteria bacterium]|nr:hypothetical protein [Candidatus Goldiibacteriota bacterium]
MKKYLIIILLLPFYLNAMEFIPGFDINGSITYPTILTNESSELDKKIGVEAGFAGSFMVNTDFLPQLWFIPTITFNYSSTMQPLNVDDQRFLFTQWMDIYFSGGFNYEILNNLEARIRGFYRLDYAQQTMDEKIGKGLYDYIDTGFYTELFMKTEIYYPSEITLGFKYIDKRFPNYESLISMIDPDTIGGTLNASAKKEKDNLTYSFYISDEIKLGDSGWMALFSFTYDYIPYFEQRIISQIGELTDSKRIDRFATLDISFPYYKDAISGMEIGYSLIVKTTDQNYYDSLENLDPGDDVFIPNYYSYINHIIKLSLTYEFPFELFTKYKPAAIISFSFDTLTYKERLAKSQLGIYTNEKQQENNYKLSFDIKQNITDFWNYYLNTTFIRYLSNMKWEAYGTYNYTYLTISLGTAFIF